MARVFEGRKIEMDLENDASPLAYSSRYHCRENISEFVGLSCTIRCISQIELVDIVKLCACVTQ